MPDRWTDGASYELFIGRWSRPVALEFVRWLDLPDDSAWLDFGCGTGALSQTILAVASPRLVVGCDRSPAYAGYAHEQTADARATFVSAELPDLPETAGGFDAAVAALVLNFLPDPLLGLNAMIARVRDGGTVAAYVWDYFGGMQLLRHFWDAVNALDIVTGELDEKVRFPLCRPGAMRDLFVSAGLHDVSEREIVVPTVFRNFDDYWNPFLTGQGPGPGYVQELPETRRVELRDAIRAKLPVRDDGSIALTARAWAVSGVVEKR